MLAPSQPVVAVLPVVMARANRVLARVTAVLAAYPPLVAVLYVIHVVAPQRNGPLAISEVFAPHLLVPVLALVPLVASTAGRALRIGLAAAMVIGAVRFGPGLVSFPPAPPTEVEAVISILSWNLEAGGPGEEDLLVVLRETDAGIVALQELTPGHAAAVEADPGASSAFPHRALVARDGVAGIGLLSRWPIEHATDSVGPVQQAVEVHVTAAQRLTVVNTHPFPPRYQLGSAVPLPLGYDAMQRDADLLRINAAAASLVAQGRRVLVVGDFNVTDREPAYADLAAGLWDAHLEVGQGPGSTWRPRNVEFLPFGVLRIDHVFGGPGTRPLTIAQDCTPRQTDHCILMATVAIR